MIDWCFGLLVLWIPIWIPENESGIGIRIGVTPIRIPNHQFTFKRIQVPESAFSFSSWWFQAPWKILVKIGIFPKVRGENKKYLEPPLSFSPIFSHFEELVFGCCRLTGISMSRFKYLGVFCVGRSEHAKNMGKLAYRKRTCPFNSWLVVGLVPGGLGF